MARPGNASSAGRERRVSNGVSTPDEKIPQFAGASSTFHPIASPEGSDHCLCLLCLRSSLGSMCVHCTPATSNRKPEAFQKHLSEAPLLVFAAEFFLATLTSAFTVLSRQVRIVKKCLHAVRQLC